MLLLIHDYATATVVCYRAVSFAEPLVEAHVQAVTPTTSSPKSICRSGDRAADVRPEHIMCPCFRFEMPTLLFKKPTERIEQLDRHLGDHALLDSDLFWALAQAQYSYLRAPG